MDAILLAFLFTGLYVSWLIWGNVALKSWYAEGQSDYSQDGIEIFSSQADGIWLIDDQVYLYGYFSIWNATPDSIGISIDNTYYRFGNSALPFSSWSLGTGSHVVKVYSYGTVKETILIWSSSTDLVLSRFFNVGGFVYFSSVGTVAGTPFTYFVVVRPLRKSIGRLLAEETTEGELGIPEPDDPQLSIQRTDLIREQLMKQMEHYQGMKNSLLLAIGTLFAAYGFLYTNIVPMMADTFVQGVFILAFVLGVVFLISPANKLLTQRHLEDRPSTSWYYRGRIREEDEEEHGLEHDFMKNYYLFANWDRKKILKDNTKEVVSLYHECKVIEGQYEDALSGVKTSVEMMFITIVVGFIYYSGIGIYAFTFILFGYSVLLFYTTAHMILKWRGERLLALTRRLYSCDDKTDYSLEQNQGVKDAKDLILGLDISFEPTCGYDDQHLRNLHGKAKEAARRLGRPAKKRKHLYGQEKDDYSYVGVQVPVLIEAEHGESNAIRVYPLCDNDGKITTIRQYLKELRTRDLSETSE